MPHSAKKRDGLIKRRTDVRATFSTDSGKRVLLWLTHHCHIYETSTGATFEPYEAMYRDGQRSVVNDLLHFMQDSWTPDKFLDNLEQGQRVMKEYFPEELADA